MSQNSWNIYLTQKESGIAYCGLELNLDLCNGKPIVYPFIERYSPLLNEFKGLIWLDESLQWTRYKFSCQGEKLVRENSGSFYLLLILRGLTLRVMW